MAARRLVLATTNPTKARRLRWVFEGLGFNLEGLPTQAGPGPAESGRSFKKNAEMKALFWSRRLTTLAASSDGGLQVPALGEQWDALHTARAAGPESEDVARARHLLAITRDLVGEQRRVFWAEGLAVAMGGRLLASWQAEGTQAFLVDDLDLSRLRSGFWAASLCFLPDRGLTLAEITDEALAEADPTWSRLRREARDFFLSSQADTRRG